MGLSTLRRQACRPAFGASGSRRAQLNEQNTLRIDGRNLFFTVVDDEANVAVVGLKRP